MNRRILNVCALVVAILLCVSRVQATISVVHQENIGATSISTSGTAVTITSTGSGHGLWLHATNNTGGSYYITAVSGAGTWVCPSGANTVQTFNGSVGSSSGCYTLSSTSGVTSLTVTSSTSSTFNLTLTEFSFTASSIAVDSQGSNGSNSFSGTSVTGQALTLTGSNDIIFQQIEIDSSVSSITTYSNFLAAGGTNYGAEAILLNSTSGTAPTWTVGTGKTNVISAIAFYEVVPTCSAPVLSLLPKMYDVNLPQTTTITSGCTYDCYSFNAAPASSSPPTCSAGTQISDGGTVTIPVGTNTLEAIGVESGFVNSPVTSASYNIRPMIISWNGVTVGNASGNVSAINGVSLGTAKSGSFNSWNGFTSTLPTSANMFVDFHGGTNGSQPTTTTLGNSVYSTGTGTLTWSTSGEGAGMTFSNTNSLQNLLQPINIGGTVYNQSGALGLLCTTGISVHCGLDTVGISTTSASASLGFWIQTNCAANNSVDCGAHGGLAGGGGVDYAVVHFNPGPGGSNPCNYNGIEFETHGGNAPTCLPYTNNALYRVNIQENEGEAAITVTFTNGSAGISGTNTLAANQAVQLTTTGSLPTNFATGTTYYVLSTGLSTSAFELSATQGGTPITAGSAGSGTQTATVFDQMTICTATGALLGNLVGTSFTTPEAVDHVWLGISGEEPSVAGPTFYYYSYVLDLTGKFSATGCIL